MGLTWPGDVAREPTARRVLEASRGSGGAGEAGGDGVDAPDVGALGLQGCVSKVVIGSLGPGLELPMASTVPPPGQSGRPVSQDSPGRLSAEESRRSRRRRAVKAVIAMIVVGVGVALVVRNAQPVKVNLLVGTGHPRLIWVILVCLCVGLIAGFALGGPGRRLVTRSQRRSGGILRRRRG